jgi:Uma2 family endonuclease
VLVNLLRKQEISPKNGMTTLEQPTTITSLSQLDPAGNYSYADYLTWQFEERVELFKGRLFPMAAPSTRHQRYSHRLSLSIGNYLTGKSCEIYPAPFDVRLPDRLKKPKYDGDIYTVVQPDLCVVCDAAKLDDRGCLGAPDLMVEILSPGNTQKEIDNKFRLYEEAGVREYLIVEPEDRFVLVYVLRDGEFIGLQPFGENKLLTSTVLPELTIDLAGIFAE